MNEREFHDHLRGWFREEAPPEAPDWIIQQVLDRTEGAERRARSLVWSPTRQLALALLVLAPLVIGGLAALSGILPRPTPPDPAPRAVVMRDIDIGAGVSLAVAQGPEGIWIANSSLPGAILLDPVTGERVAEVPTYEPPPPSLSRHPLATDVVVAFGSIWTIDDEFHTVTRIDGETTRVVTTVGVADYPRVAVAAAGALWVLSPLDGTLTRVDPVRNSATEIDLPRTSEQSIGHIAADDDAIWVAVGDALIALDPRSEQVIRTVEIRAEVRGVAVGDGAVWVTSGLGLTRVEAATGEAMATIEVGGDPGALALAGNLVWVADSRDETLRAVDPASEAIVEALDIGAGATDIDVSGSSLVVLNQVDRTVTLIRISD